MKAFILLLPVIVFGILWYKAEVRRSEAFYWLRKRSEETKQRMERFK